MGRVGVVSYSRFADTPIRRHADTDSPSGVASSEHSNNQDYSRAESYFPKHISKQQT